MNEIFHPCCQREGVQTRSDNEGHIRERIFVPWKFGLIAMESLTDGQVDGQYFSAHCVFWLPWDQVMAAVGAWLCVEMWFIAYVMYSTFTWGWEREATGRFTHTISAAVALPSLVVVIGCSGWDTCS